MLKKDLLKEVSKHLEPILGEKNLELVELEFVKEGANYYLRIFIDNEEGIKVDDCEFVSRRIDKILDEKDFIEQSYILEVSSPGLDRPLKKPSDYEKYKGEMVDIKLYKPLDKKKEYQGKLISLLDEVITIEDEEGCQLKFNKQDVAICRLAVIF